MNKKPISRKDKSRARSQRRQEKKKIALEWNICFNGIKNKFGLQKTNVIGMANFIDPTFDGTVNEAKELMLMFYRNNYKKTTWQECKIYLQEISAPPAAMPSSKRDKSFRISGQSADKVPSTRSFWNIKQLSEDFIKSPEFLDDYRWKQIRLEVLSDQRKRLGKNLCECCGQGPQTGHVLNVDHIKPRKHTRTLPLT